MVRILVFGAALIGGAAVAQAPTASAQAPAIAPAQLAAARAIAAKMLPAGSYQRMMSGSMSQMMGSMTSQMAAMPLAPFLQSAGLPQSEVARLGSVTIRQIMDIVDPAYDQRMRLIMPAMMEQMGALMTQFEPDMREGLAEAYARRFSAAQLSDIEAFLNTPSGSAFAGQNLTLNSDPAVMGRMQAFMPKLIAALPGIMQKASASAAGLPPPKTPETLTDADRQKLAKLLGVDPAKLNRPGS